MTVRPFFLFLLAAAFSSPLLCSAAQTQDPAAASLHIYPPPPTSTLRGDSISWPDAHALVAHSVAASAGLPHAIPQAIALANREDEQLVLTMKEMKIDLLAEPTANLWIVVEDYPESKAILDTIKPTYRVRGDQDMGAQLMLFGSRTADAIIEADDDAWPIVVSSEKSTAGTGPAARVLVGASEIKTSATKRLPEHVQETVKEIAKTTYADMEPRAVHIFGKDAAVLKSLESMDAHLMGELEFSMSMIEALKMQRHLNRAGPETVPLFVSITLSGLRGLREQYGEDSEQYKAGVMMTAKAVQEITTGFSDMHEKNVLVQILTVPPSISGLLLRRASRATTALGSTCPTTLKDCETAFSNCTNHGACTLTNVTDSQQCYLCKCSTQYTDDAGKPVKGFSGPVAWTGDSCQYQDISVPFHILFWTSVSLIITTM
ncbi:hypothetical protein DFJ77DRAFT_285286 [Powellomyces hirtus]|nr:hypothetical protein DFJ77DRAFT_285286 [Powellomyces hirtus]